MIAGYSMTQVDIQDICWYLCGGIVTAQTLLIVYFHVSARTGLRISSFEALLHMDILYTVIEGAGCVILRTEKAGNNTGPV